MLEVLVAFVILSLSLSVIMRLFSTSLSNIGRGATIAHSITVAESVLASLGIDAPLVEGESNGVDAEGYRWQAKVSRFTDVASPIESSNAPLLFQIDLAITVADTHPVKPVLELTTLRFAPMP